MKACITEQSHMLFDGRVHVLSWMKDLVSENTEYKCSFISKAGNTTSEVRITVEEKGRLVLNVCHVWPDPGMRKALQLSPIEGAYLKTVTLAYHIDIQLFMKIF